MELWLSRSPAQRPAMWLALSAILSLAANVTEGLLATGRWGAAVLGAVPPAMLAAQLGVLHMHESGQARGRARRPAAASAPSRPATRRSRGPKPAVPDAELLPQMRAHEKVHGRLSKRRAMTVYGIGDPRALRLLKKLHPSPSSRSTEQLCADNPAASTPS